MGQASNNNHKQAIVMPPLFFFLQSDNLFSLRTPNKQTSKIEKSTIKAGLTHGGKGGLAPDGEGGGRGEFGEGGHDHGVVRKSGACGDAHGSDGD